MKQALKKIGTLILTLALVLGLISAAGITAVDVQAATTAMQTDTEYTVTISEEGGTQIFSFTPAEDGYYSFYTTGEYDTYGVLYDADMDEISEDDDSGSDLNAKILLYLTADETYYVEFFFFEAELTGSFSAYVEEIELLSFTESTDVSIDLSAAGEGESVYYVFSPSEDGLYTLTLAVSGNVENYCYVDMNLREGSVDNYIMGTSVWLEEDNSSDSASCYGELDASETYILEFLYEGEEPESVTASASPAQFIDFSGTYSGSAAANSSEYVFLTYTPSETGLYTISISSNDMSDCGEGESIYIDADILDADMIYLADAYIGAYEDEENSYGETLTLQAGETYYIFIEYGNGTDEQVDYVLSVTKQDTIDISSAAAYSMTGTDSAYLCYTPSETGVYVFTVTSSGSSTSYEAYAAVFGETWNGAGIYYYYEVDDDTVYGYSYDCSMVLEAGTTYYISFEGYDSDSGSETFTVTVSEADVIDISQIGSYETTYEADSGDSYADYDSEEVWLMYTASSSGSFTVTLSTAFDSDADYSELYAWCYVYSEAGELIEELSIYDDSDEKNIVFDLQEGQTIYIRLYDSIFTSGGKSAASISVNIASEHTHDYEAAAGTDPTCTEDGYIEYYCEGCGDSYRVVLPASGHTYEIVDTTATCTEPGTTTYECSVCGDTYTVDDEALGHDYVETDNTATCTEAGTVTYVCSRCGDTYTADVDALGHDYVVTDSADATCTEDGYTTYTCSRCGDSYTEVIAAASHTLTAVDAVDATCTTAGNIAYYTCSVCGKLFADAECTTELTAADVVVAASGHVWDSGVTDSDGSITYTCTVCGGTYINAVSASVSASTSSDSDGDVTAADTSDVFPVGSYLALILAAGCAAVLLLRKRAF